MTPKGELILNIYSIVATLFLLVLNMLKMYKDPGEGWELVVLIPVLIYLVNII